MGSLGSLIYPANLLWLLVVFRIDVVEVEVLDLGSLDGNRDIFVSIVGVSIEVVLV